MDRQDYATPLCVSRATFDEVLARMRLEGRVVPKDAEVTGLLDVRGVLLKCAPFLDDEPEKKVAITGIRTPHEPIRAEVVVEIYPAPEDAKKEGATFTIECQGWRYMGTPVEIDNRTGAARFLIARAAWKQEIA